MNKSIPLLFLLLISNLLTSTCLGNSNNIKVGVYYYVWYEEGYGTYHWNGSQSTTVVDTPVLGYYSSQNSKVIFTHLNWFTQADIDFIIVSWWGIGTYEDNTTKILFRNVSHYNAEGYDHIEITIMVEPYNNWTGNYYNFTEIYDYVYDTYVIPYPNVYMHLNGKPLILFYMLVNNSTEVNEIPFDERFTVRIAGNRPYCHWSYAVWYPNDEHKIGADGQIGVMPRFDSTRLGRPPELTYAWDPTYELQCYDKQWQNILDKKDDISIVTICTWNEFSERTFIEPAQDATSHKPLNHFYVYEKTVEYIKLLKSEPSDPPWYKDPEMYIIFLVLTVVVALLVISLVLIVVVVALVVKWVHGHF